MPRAPVAIILAILLGACSTEQHEATCDAVAVATERVRQDLPGHDFTRPVQVSTEGRTVVVSWGHHPGWWGGSPHARVRMTDCTVLEIWATQ
jgi:hypothetical protein